MGKILSEAELNKLRNAPVDNSPIKLNEKSKVKTRKTIIGNIKDTGNPILNFITNPATTITLGATALGLATLGGSSALTASVSTGAKTLLKSGGKAAIKGLSSSPVVKGGLAAAIIAPQSFSLLDIKPKDILAAAISPTGYLVGKGANLLTGKEVIPGTNKTIPELIKENPVSSAIIGTGGLIAAGAVIKSKFDDNVPSVHKKMPETPLTPISPVSPVAQGLPTTQAPGMITASTGNQGVTKRRTYKKYPTRISQSVKIAIGNKIYQKAKSI